MEGKRRVCTLQIGEHLRRRAKSPFAVDGSNALIIGLRDVPDARGEVSCVTCERAGVTASSR